MPIRPLFGSAVRIGVVASVAGLAAAIFGRSPFAAGFLAAVAAALFRCDAPPHKKSPSLALFVGLYSASVFAGLSALCDGEAASPARLWTAASVGAGAALVVALGPGARRGLRRARPLGPTELRVKRAGDIVLACVATPFVGGALLAVRALRDPVWKSGFFYSQVRTGFTGRLISLKKIRTMRFDVEADGRPRWSERAAESLSGIGVRLRRRWVDELPQIFDVLRGDLSLVGPRPERPEFVEGLALKLPKYSRRLLTPPGVTGLAQILGFAGDTSLRKRLVCDRLYARRWSPWFDVRVLLATAFSALRRKKRVASTARTPERGSEPRSSAWKPPSTSTSPRSTNPGS